MIGFKTEGRYEQTMKVILLICMLYLWSSEAQGETCEDQVESEECIDWNNPHKVKLMYDIRNLSCIIEGTIMVTCNNNDNKTRRHSNISINNICCTPSESKGNGPISTNFKNMTTTSIETSAMDTMITTPIIDCKSQAARSDTSIGLGVVVGLLVVLLIIVTFGWIWTCWITKKNTSKCVPIDLLSNLSYGNSQQTLQNRPLPTTIPTYETISPLSNFMDGIKLDLAEPKEEECDVGNNREAYCKLNSAQRDNKKRENKDHVHNSGQRGHQGEEEVTEPSSGTGLQEIQHSNANTSTECLLDSVVPDEEGQSASPAVISKTSQESCETTNSAVKETDKELDGTTQEHDHDQTETSEKEKFTKEEGSTQRL